MGRWFARFLLSEGKEVIITGRNEQKLREAREQLPRVEVATSVEAVKGADAILVAVPMDSFEEVVQQVQPYVRPRQIVMDITSTKAFPVEVMHKYIKSGLVLGMHPVFGPGASSVANQNFVLTPINEQENALAGKVKAYLEAREARVTMMSPQEHDEMMAVVLGLSHFIALVSADTLLSFDSLKQMKAAGGSSYKLLLTLVESVIAEAPEFYASLQMTLPNVAAVEELFQRRVKAWADLVKNRDGQSFVRMMSALRDKFEKSDPDFRKAYHNLYRVVDGL